MSERFKRDSDIAYGRKMQKERRRLCISIVDIADALNEPVVFVQQLESGQWNWEKYRAYYKRALEKLSLHLS